MTIGEQLKGKGVVFSECDIYKKNKNEQLFNAIKNRNYYKIRQSKGFNWINYQSRNVLY